jgi:hypothetical protein
MKKWWLMVMVLAMSVAAASEVRVTCPQELQWTTEGYCKLDFDKLKTAACPRGSHLAQPSVTGPRICMSKGSCPDGLQPSNRGVCVKK